MTWRSGPWRVAALVLACGAAAPVAADKPARVAAELTCELPAGRGRLSDDVPCALRVTATDPDDRSGLRASVRTRWVKHAKRTGPLRAKDRIAAGDVLAVTLTPAGLDAIDFEPCIDFSIDATVESGAGGVVWKLTIPVTQRCTPPRPKIACTYTSRDGRTHDALKGSSRIDGDVSCAVSKLPAESGLASMLTLFERRDARGKRELTEGPRCEYIVKEGTFTFRLVQGKHFLPCDEATIQIRVSDGRGFRLYARDLEMRQRCRG